LFGINIKDRWSVKPILVFLATILPQMSAFVLEGSKTSYAQFRKWDGGTNSALSFEFRTEQTDGLLLYTDDSSTCDFLEVKLVGSAVRLRFNTGFGGQILTVGEQKYSDGSWHKVDVIKNGANTTLSVDKASDSVICDGEDLESLVLGNLSSNQYVYVGGLPSWYTTKLKALAVPSVAFEPRFRGSFRNLMYLQTGAGAASPEKQEMMAYKGVRASTVDACQHESPCQHASKCLSTDQGPICECDNTGYKGIFCEQESPTSEAVFRGREGVKYDLNNIGGEPIITSVDKISLYFKTRKSSGLLFYNGHGSDYLLIHLKDGGVSLTINQRSGKLDTQVKPSGEPFNDNVWHQVTVTRETKQQEDGQTSCQVTMRVDGKYSERWKTVGRFSHLASSTTFLGGSDGRENIQIIRNINNLVGCLKKVVYTADSVILDLLALAKEGNPLMSTLGKMEWACQDIGTSHPLPYRSGGAYQSGNLGYYLMQQGGVISFADSESFLVLPSWKPTSQGSIAVKIRTTEPNGLLMFNSGHGNSRDYFGLELVDGFMYVHLNLGKDPVKFRASRTAQQLSDGEWHKVELQLNQNNGRITIDGDMELFTTQGQSDELDLGGSFYIGGLDYMDPNLSLPTSIWSASLKLGYVGCLKDLVINGADIDVVAYTHEQNSGSIRSSCHTMLGRCHDRPCLHGGSCKEGWNRYICDCSQTSFFGSTCSRGTSTVEFTGDNFITVDRKEEKQTEVQDTTLRFRTTMISGLLFLAKSQHSLDTLELSLVGGQVRIYIRLGHYEKEMTLGQSLNDDLWHTITFKRRGNIFEGYVDDEEPKKVTVHGAEPVMSCRYYHIGGISPRNSVTSSAKNFEGRLQQLVINGERVLDEAHLKQIEYEGNVKFQHMEDSVYHPVSFTSHHTYLGMPQLKAYNIIDIYFQIKTTEEDGLIMYNGGKDDDFIAVELIKGHIHYTFNMGYGPVTLKDNSVNSLADNKYHSVWIRRPTRYEQMIIVDNYHKVSSSGIGDNYHLNLDGILFLGGVRSNMYKDLPKPLLSEFGFQGCLASLELNGDVVDPAKDALVTSPAVSEGCQGGSPTATCTNSVMCANGGICKVQYGIAACYCDHTSFTGSTCKNESVSYEFSGRGGVITYNYPEDRQPDTKGDKLTLAFISGMSDAILVRIDSSQSSDYLMLKLTKGIISIAYNLGTEDILIGDKSRKLNDGNYHVIRFERNGPNSTLQVDDNKKIVNTPDGRHLTVFNSQSLVQVGGRWNEVKQTLEQPFQGVMAGIVYNGLRPLDLAHDKSDRTKIRGSVKTLTSIPYDYKDKNPGLFVDTGVQSTAELYSHDGSGEATKHDTTSHLVGIRFKEGGFMPCDDDEDLCDFGSGHGENSVFIPNQSDMSQSTGVGGRPIFSHVVMILNMSLVLACALLN